MIVLSKNTSHNVKLGRGVYTTSRKVGASDGGTCPKECSHLSKKTCYAMYGNVNIHQLRSPYDETDSERLKSWVKALPHGVMIRHHVSGDVMTDNAVDEEYVNSMLDAHSSRPDVVGWVYTHAFKNLESQKVNSVPNITFNASCDSVEDLAFALSNGWPAVLVVDEDADDHVIEINDERVRVKICLAQTNSGMVCSACKLCTLKERSSVVGFRIHGKGKSKW